MSKRKGEFVTLDELLDEVPYDVCRFFFLMYSPSTHMDFDLKLAKEKSMKNPVYYFQYAYVRALNILKKAPLTASGADLSLLSSETEIDLAKELLRFQDIVLEGVQELKAHHLTQWALSLAKKFHNFYESEKIITQDKEKEPLMAARLALVEATKYIFENLAFLLGISLPEKM
jgi:arginyl-tRNA synthetase